MAPWGSDRARRLGRRAAIGILALSLVAGVVAAGWYARFWMRSERVGDIRVDPSVTLRPDTQYTVTLWETDLLLPWAAGGYRSAVEQAVAEFQQAHPNVDVRIVWQPPATFSQALTEAANRGDPPDVAALPAGQALVAPGLQVPVDRYLDAATSQDLWAGALDGLRVEGHVWGWPRWVEPALWAVDGKWLHAAGLEPDAARQGWTAAQLAKGVETLRRRAVAAIDPASSRWLADLMAASGWPDPVTADGQLAWSEASLQLAADLAASLRRHLTVTQSPPSTRRRLAMFRSGRALFLAPTSPWLNRHLAGLRTTGSSPRGAGGSAWLWLPPPRLALPSGDPQPARASSQTPQPAPPSGPAGRRPGQPGEVAAYAVFRQRRYRGHGTVKAAMLLAAHLSRRLGTWVGQQLVVVPAYRSELPRWTAASPLGELEAKALGSRLESLVTPDPTPAVAELRRRALSEVLPGALARLWDGRLDPAGFAHEVAIRLEALRRASPLSEAGPPPRR